MAKQKKSETLTEQYIPSTEEQAVITKAYTDVDEFINRRNEKYPQFNYRTLTQYIDDGDKRLNSYVLPKNSYNPPKEDWQANVPLPTVRNSMKKLLAGFSLQVADLDMTCSGEDKPKDVIRADVAKNLVKGSYLEEENPVLDNFWDAWENTAKGTVVIYEGYLKTRVKQKYIESYDLVTGEITFNEREVDIDDKCYSYQVPLTEFYPWNYYINDVQKQPKVAWIRYVEQDEFDIEFGQYKNAKFVKTKGQVKNAETDSFFYRKKWVTRVKDDQIEIIKIYRMGSDEYVVIANGVLLLDSCLLWKFNGKKVYPFAKTILEPFTDKRFFYGKSFPDIMAAEYDLYNATFNTMSDRQFRAGNPGLMIGVANKDAFELEDELILGGKTRIYVEDVNQVKEVPITGINNADVLMLKLIANSIEESSPSLTGVLAQKQATAREVVLANEKIEEMRNMYTMMMTELWRQKYQLRLANIQMNYPQKSKVIDDNGKEKEIYRTFVITDTVLDSTTGERGTLAVQFRKITATQRKKTENDIAVEEETMKSLGINYRKIIIPPEYLSNGVYKITVVESSVLKTSMGLKQAVTMEKLGTIQKLFPQIFTLNQKEYFEELLGSYGDKTGKQLEKFNALETAQADQAAQLAGVGGEQAEPQGIESTGGGSQMAGSTPVNQ